MLLIRGTRQSLTAVTVYAASAGVVAGIALHTLFGVLQGDLMSNMLSVGLSIFAGASFTVGLANVFGPVGMGIGSATLMLLANPISSVAVPGQFLPEPWGAIGQLLTPGATATLLRDLSYFPSADPSGPWLVLIAWAVWAS